MISLWLVAAVLLTPGDEVSALLTLPEQTHMIMKQNGVGAGNAGSIPENIQASTGSGEGLVTVCKNGCDSDNLEDAIALALPGDTIELRSGTYPTGQVIINKDLTIRGAGKTKTFLSTIADTGSSGDARGWFVVGQDICFVMSDLVLDGGNYNIWQAIRHEGFGAVERVVFRSIKYEPTGPSYTGYGIAAFGLGSGNVHVRNCEFSDMGRVGVLYFGPGINGAEYTGNTYTGKGSSGAWFDYGLEVSGGAVVIVDDSVFRDCSGTEAGFSSAGILITTYFGGGSNASIANSTFRDNDHGILVGLDGNDVSEVVATGCSFSGNTIAVAGNGTMVEAPANWWGNDFVPAPAGQNDSIEGNVNHLPVISSIADLNLQVADSSDPTKAGENLVYTVALTNNGPDDASDITMNYALPPGVDLVSVNGPEDCAEGSCSVASLASGGFVNFTVEVTVNQEASGTLAAMFDVDSETVDPDGTDNAQTETTGLTSSTSTVPDNVPVGEGTEIGDQVTVGPHSEIGSNVTIEEGVNLSERVSVGDSVLIEMGANVGVASTLNSGAVIGSFSTLLERVEIGEDTIIDSYVTIRNGTKIQGGVTIAGPNTTLHESVEIASDTHIEAGVVLSNHTDIGSNTHIRSGVFTGDSVYIGSNSDIGPGTHLYNHVKVYDYVTLGERVMLKDGVTVDNGSSLGNDVRVENQAKIRAGVNIGADVQMGTGATVEANAIIGANAQIGNNVTIGAGAEILPGAVVNFNVPANTIYPSQ